MKSTYINATVQLLQEGADIDAVLQGVRSVMDRRGHGIQYRSVLQSVVQIIEQHQQSERAHVQVAKETDVADLKAVIEAHVKSLGAPLTYHVTTHPELIGGSRISYQHQIVDASYKTLLLRLYDRIVGSNA